MMESFKRYFNWRGTQRDLNALAEWAQRRGHGFKRARGDHGFVMDGELDGRTWRLEWGPPQRAYLDGPELRVRMEMGVSNELQMLVLTLPLMDRLERQAYEEFTDPVQTQIGTNAPEEMRWLVMFPKINLTDLGSLKQHFGAVASVPTVGLAWIEGQLAAALALAAKSWLTPQQPLVLMTLRGRLYLRTLSPEPSVQDVSHALSLFTTAAHQVLRVVGEVGDGSGHAHSGATTAWQTIAPDSSSEPPKR